MKRKNILDLGFAQIDIDRKRRRGFAEVVFCQSKTPEQLAKIVSTLMSAKQQVLLTKLKRSKFLFLKRRFPKLKYSPESEIGFLSKEKIKNPDRFVLVICAGTGDIPVAEEAAITLEIMGNRVVRLWDVGIAGCHRLFRYKEILSEANVIVVVAGMEGALASLVSGLVRVPVIAVPTSCGYGANFKGISALLTMINSCSAGIAVVNIDNGFGAGYIASLINNLN